MAPPRVPRATYRLQFSKDFTFAQAETLVPYFASLGISHLYASPVFKARAGSTHGYDIVDHNVLNPEIGDEAAFERLTDALARHDMGLILDIVPNHVGVGGADNPWWIDLLEWGRRSPYAPYFDVDWQPARRELRGKVLLPFLADHYGAVLERGDLVPRFDRDDGSLSVWYGGHRFPINPADYTEILGRALRLTGDDAAAASLAAIAAEARALAQGRAGTRPSAAHRQRACGIKRQLRALMAAHDAIDRAVAGLAADVPALHRLLEAQAYRVSYWRTAADEINYRRFFDINDLAGLRMQNARLFDLAHRKVLALLAAGRVHGLRIDHVDGLYNPAQYCRRLQAAAGQALGARASRPPNETQPVWLVVEKILAAHERVRRDWPVAGTTGYDFANQVIALFIDEVNEGAMEQAYTGFIGQTIDFGATVHAARRQIIAEVMGSELAVLADKLARLAATHWRSRDFTQPALAAALAEVVTWFPVYRTYVTGKRVTDLDRRYIGWAVARARKHAPDIDGALFDFLEGVLDTSAARGAHPAYRRAAVVDVAMSVQQYTGPVMAKGFEDTALYRYNRLLALNEVGGDPRRFGLSPASFHQIMRRRRRHAPAAMLATATHDTKRGEDVRARLAALAEMPEEWRHHLERWSRLNELFRQQRDDGPAPGRNDEIFLYQTLLGAWPLEGPPPPEFAERMAAVLVKTLREAKQRTSWRRPDEAYEEACLAFLRRLLEIGRHNPFLDDFLPFQCRLARLGMVNGLAQTLIKLTAPGVPDIYQGGELWQLALVDPDNRRPVDWRRRRDLLAGLDRRTPGALLDAWTDGALKLHVIRRTLAHRRADPDLYAEGSYQPLAVRGERRRHALAYARLHDGRALIVVVPRLLHRMWPEEAGLPPLGDAWRGLAVEAPKGLAGMLYDPLKGREVPVGAHRARPLLTGEDLFSDLPVALLLGGGRYHLIAGQAP